MDQLYLHFFLSDGPIISDVIRIFIYGYLLIECLLAKYAEPPIGDSPLQAHLLLQRTHPLFWCISNKFSSFFLFIHKYKYLQTLVIVSQIFWCFCIIGLGGVLSRVVTGVSVFILSTTNIGIGKIGPNHRWHVPSWTLIALIFTKFKYYSLDSLITRHISQWYNVEPSYLIFDSGFSSKFIQCISIYMLFSAGISKLRNAGITWILPGNLIFCLSDPSINSSIVLTNFRKHLRQFIIRHSVCTFILSTSSFLIEMTSIFAIFIPSTRLSCVILAWLFHFGIWLVMNINYFPQCVCYLMIIDNPFRSIELYESQLQDIKLFDIVFIILATMIIFGYGLSLYARYEGWPFTPVEMFSMDRRLFTHDHLIDEQQLQDIATKEVQNANAFGNEIQFSSGTMWIRITKNDETEDLTDYICSRVCAVTVTFQYHLWYVVMQSILVSKVEIQRFLNRLFEILIVSDDVQLLCITDYINVQIHYKAGWKTYATTYSPKNLRKNVYR